MSQKCPSGLLTESRLNEIYADIFTTGDCKLFSKHLFSALVQNSRHLRDENSPTDRDDQIYFQHFIANLSVLVRGNLEERVKWLFSFYDLNKNGQINISESIYKNLR
jgi:Ca2+-binding EF-hand superfamily protein